MRPKFVFITFFQQFLLQTSECLENFQNLFRLFRKIYVLFGFYFHFNFVITRKNFMGKRNLMLVMSTSFFCLWCWLACVTLVLWPCSIIRLTAERSKNINFITKAKKAIWSDWVRDLSGTPECAKSLWIRWRRRISGNGGESWTNGKIG